MSAWRSSTGHDHADRLRTIGYRRGRCRGKSDGRGVPAYPRLAGLAVMDRFEGSRPWKYSQTATGASGRIGDGDAETDCVPSVLVIARFWKKVKTVAEVVPVAGCAVKVYTARSRHKQGGRADDEGYLHRLGRAAGRCYRDGRRYRYPRSSVVFTPTEKLPGATPVVDETLNQFNPELICDATVNPT